MLEKKKVPPLRLGVGGGGTKDPEGVDLRFPPPVQSSGQGLGRACAFHGDQHIC